MVKIIEVGNVVGGGGSGGAPSGAAGGSLAGTYPNPTLAAGSVGSTQIVDASIVNADLANMVPNTVKGRITAGTGVPENVTAAQLATILGTGSGGGTTNFLRADGTWAAPAGGGGSSVFSDSAFAIQDNTDPSKQLALEVSSIPTATIRTLALPTMTANDVVVTEAATQALTNKSAHIPILTWSHLSPIGGITFRHILDTTSVNDYTTRTTAVELAGNLTTPARFGFLHQGGTPGTPAQTVTNAVIGSFTARGYSGTAYSTAAAASVDFIAEENVVTATTPVKGTRFRVAVTPLGTNTLTDAFRVNTDAVPSGVFRGSVVVGAGATMASPTSGYGVECKTGAIGYGVGTGTSVTQITSQNTPVTANFLCGKITLFAAAGTTAWNSFVVNNSLIGANDMVVTTIDHATQNYNCKAISVRAGQFNLAFQSMGGTASASPTVTFMVIKGVVT